MGKIWINFSHFLAEGYENRRFYWDVRLSSSSRKLSWAWAQSSAEGSALKLKSGSAQLDTRLTSAVLGFDNYFFEIMHNLQWRPVACTVNGYKFNHLPINSITAVAAEARVNPALPSTAVVEFMAKWSNLCPRTVEFFHGNETCQLASIFL